MPLIRLPASATAEEATACLKKHGYVIIEKRARADEVERVQRETAPYLERTAFGTSDITGQLTRRTGRLIARSATARKLIMDPLVLQVVDQCLSAPKSTQLSLTEVIALSPGAPAQFIHRDGMADGPLAADYEAQISTLWAMTDYTEDMGATRIVPGSHEFPKGMRFSVEDTLPAVMPRGSVMIYSGRLYHGGGENRSRRVRQALNINYQVGWLRQEENQYLSCPPDIARTLPHDLLRLMGYNTCMSFGRVGDWVDPLSFLLGEETRLDERVLFSDLMS